MRNTIQDSNEDSTLVEELQKDIIRLSDQEEKLPKKFSVNKNDSPVEKQSQCHIQTAGL